VAWLNSFARFGIRTIVHRGRLVERGHYGFDHRPRGGSGTRRSAAGTSGRSQQRCVRGSERRSPDMPPSPSAFGSGFKGDHSLASQTTRTCIFCGDSGTLTTEHVLPRWLFKALVPPTADARTYSVWKDRRVQAMKGFDLRYRGVCAACNHGWMHDLELAFRSVMLPALTGTAILPGQELTLDQPAQVVAATWGLKTWMLLELALKHVRNGAVESVDVMRYLYERRQPPEQIEVFISVKDPDWRDPAQLMTVGIPRPPADPVGAMALFTIGFLAFYFYVPAIVDGTAQAAPLKVRGDVSLALTQIWPVQVSEVRWPPSRMLSREAVEGIFL
jgi:hypothetical protein